MVPYIKSNPEDELRTWRELNGRKDDVVFPGDDHQIARRRGFSTSRHVNNTKHASHLKHSLSGYEPEESI